MNILETSRKHYWKQTAKLFGIVLAMLVAAVVGMVLTNSIEPNPIVNLSVTVLSIVAAVKLYEGYGFLRGFGGYMLVKVAAQVLVVLPFVV